MLNDRLTNNDSFKNIVTNQAMVNNPRLQNQGQHVSKFCMTTSGLGSTIESMNESSNNNNRNHRTANAANDSSNAAVF